MRDEGTPEGRWLSSDKTVDDLRLLMTQDPQWHTVLRPFFRKFTNKYEYQKYLRAVLEELLEWGYN